MGKFPLIRRTLSALLFAPFTWSGLVAAQNYPDKPVRIIIPFAPGGATDIVFRMLTPPLSEHLGQSVVIDNRPGGAATIGMNLIAKAPAGGYTIGVANVSLTVPSAIGHLKSGRLVGLGVSAATRDPAIPEIPRIAEVVPGYEFFDWQGVVAPAGTPPAVISRLHTEIVKSLADPEPQERIAAVGARTGGTPQELARSSGKT